MDLIHRSCLKRWWLCLWLVLALVSFCAFATVHTMNIDGSKYFFNSLRTLNEFYYLEISPPRSTLYVWRVLITWQILWILCYSVFMFLRKGANFSQTSSVTVPSVLLFTFTLTNICLILSGWQYDYQNLIIHLLIFILASVFLHITYVFGHIHLDKITPLLFRQGLETDIWLFKIVVLNGLAYYAAFLSVVGCYSFAQVWTYSKYISSLPSTGVTAGLVVLTVYIFVCLLLRFKLYVDHLNYIFSPFVVWVVTLGCIIIEHWPVTSFNLTFIAILLIILGVSFCVSVVRQSKSQKISCY